MENYPFNEDIQKEDLNNCDILRCGLHFEAHNKKYNIKNINTTNYLHIPFYFYDNFNIPYNIFWNYFKLPETIQEESLYNILIDNNIEDYVFVHNTTSDKQLSHINTEWLKSIYNIDYNITLIINPNINMYKKSDYFYDIAEMFINKNILNYKDVLINATSIFLSNSAFFCLAIHLDLKATNKIVFKRDDNSINYLWTPEYGYNKTNTFIEL
jgi:hypothetical protein